MKDAQSTIDRLTTEIEQQRKWLDQLLFTADGDHMTACDKTMGATHPCTCGATEIRLRLGNKEVFQTKGAHQDKPAACKHGHLVGKNYRCTICNPLSNDERRAIGIESEQESGNG